MAASAIGSQRLHLEQPAATFVTRCLRPDGFASVLLHPPGQYTRPILLLRLATLAEPRQLAPCCFGLARLSWFAGNTTEVCA
jgi:hypothetical protein